jgi:putative transposase
MAELNPDAPSTPTVQAAAALAEDTADRLPSGMATRPGEKDWQSEYESFVQRELSGAQVEYLFLDALRACRKPLPKPSGEEEDVLCAWAIDAEGREVLLHLASCNAESYERWLEFLRDMVERGLSAPVLAIAHGTSGVMGALGEVFPNSLQQRCLSLRIREVAEEIPRSARAEVMAMVQAAYYAPSPRLAARISADMLKLYSARYPSAMRSFRDDWATCIAYLRCPPADHSRIRTTTLLRRGFAEEHRRTIDSSSESERQQLRLLRRELGLLDGRQEAAQPCPGRTRPGDQPQHLEA